MSIYNEDGYVNYVLDVVAVRVAGDPDDADLGFPVLVRAEDDVAAHGQIPNFRYVGPRSRIEIKRAFPARFLYRRPTKKSRHRLMPAHYDPACCSQVT